MERYEVLTTIKQQKSISKASEVLERAGIPLMVEHVEVSEAGENSVGFKVLVPHRYTEYASKLVHAAMGAA